MKNEERISRMREVFKEIDKHNETDPSAPDEGTAPQEETDPHVQGLIEQAWELQKQLDPLVREAMRDKPEALAEWDRIMHMCDDDMKPEDDPGPDKS